MTAQNRLSIPARRLHALESALAGTAERPLDDALVLAIGHASIAAHDGRHGCERPT